MKLEQKQPKTFAIYEKILGCNWQFKEDLSASTAGAAVESYLKQFTPNYHRIQEKASREIRDIALLEIVTGTQPAEVMNSGCEHLFGFQYIGW